ncbi:MAG: hypothetical protein R6W06_07625 [Prochlorococcaceae cyanobacterium]
MTNDQIEQLRDGQHGWATCPITQNGVVRIMAQPAYPNPQRSSTPAMRSGPYCKGLAS